MSPIDALDTITNAVAAVAPVPNIPTEAQCLPARKIAQQVLKEHAMNRDTFARGAAGLSLLFSASLEAGSAS